MINNFNHLTELSSSNQTIRARVELYNGSTLAKICDCGDILEEFTVEKTGEKKFFGFGICQKLKATLIDIHNVIDIDAIDSVEASFGVNSEYVYPFPKFYLQKVDRDEVFNVIKITAYDALYSAASHKVSELVLTQDYTIKLFVEAIGAVLGLPVAIDAAALESFTPYYDTGANFSGKESIREALDAVAEATQTIYYIDKDWNLYFKRLDITGDIMLTIDKSQYVELTDEGARTLANIAHTTELGDNVVTVSRTLASEGDTQYITDNPFWNIREDLGALMDNAQAALSGLTINQFSCEWSGNYLLEIGDKISLTKEDNSIITTYVLDDNIEFNGTLWQKNNWSFSGTEVDSPANPTSLGDALNLTFARVDKIKQDITLLTQETEDNFSQLSLNVDGISAIVQSTQERVSTIESNGATKKDIEEVETKVSEFKLGADEAILEFKTLINDDGDGVKKVSGSGFSFSENGLNISKTNTDISTQITENGMTVANSNKELLTANSGGVMAADLHATTYIYIGDNSRLESYTARDGEQRTACFWYGI